MKKQNEIKSKSVIRREAVQNKVKCETCDGKQLILVDHVGLVHPEYEPCPDCTASQPECPNCGAPEIEAYSPRTVYRCGSSDYDGRPKTFRESELCRSRPQKSENTTSQPIDVRTLESRVLTHAYSGVLLKSDDGEEFGICLRDSGFEFQYNNVWYEAKEGILKKLGEPAPQPTDEEIREAFCQTIPEYKLGIPVETLFNIEEFKTALYHFSNGYTSQSAKLKRQADEIEELQEENNSLSVSIRKVTDERDTLSSLLSEAVEGLKVNMKKQNKVKCTTCQDTKTRCGGAGQCDHDGSECFSDGRNCGEYSPEIPCPDCTAPQPTDEEKKPIDIEKRLYQIWKDGFDSESTHQYDFSDDVCNLESDVQELEAKLKEQADEIEFLSNALDVEVINRDNANRILSDKEDEIERLKESRHKIIMKCKRVIKKNKTLSSLLRGLIEGFDDLLGNAMELYTYYPNNFRKNKGEYFKEDLELLAKLEQFTND